MLSGGEPITVAAVQSTRAARMVGAAVSISHRKVSDMVADLLSVTCDDLAAVLDREALAELSDALARALVVARIPSMVRDLEARRAELVASVPDVDAVIAEARQEQARIGDVLAMVRRELAVLINISTATRVDADRRSALYEQERALVLAIDDARRRGEAAEVAERKAQADLVLIDERADALRAIELDGAQRAALVALGEVLGEVR